MDRGRPGRADRGARVAVELGGSDLPNADAEIIWEDEPPEFGRGTDGPEDRTQPAAVRAHRRFDPSQAETDIT